MDNTSLFFLIFNLHGQSPILDQIMIFGAGELIYFMFLLSFILGLKGRIKEKRSLLLIILGLLTAGLFIKFIHLFIIESRPFVNFKFTPLVDENTIASFPSIHATLSAVSAFAYTYYKSKWALIFLTFMIWIGFARVFTGVHYPLDVLGGFITGLLSVIVAVLIKKLLKKTLLCF